MTAYSLTTEKITKRVYALLHGAIFHGILLSLGVFITLRFLNFNLVKIIPLSTFSLILGAFLRLGVYELDKRDKIKKSQENNYEKPQA